MKWGVLRLLLSQQWGMVVWSGPSKDVHFGISATPYKGT